jgi:hypothetical protein
MHCDTIESFFSVALVDLYFVLVTDKGLFAFAPTKGFEMIVCRSFDETTHKFILLLIKMQGGVLKSINVNGYIIVSGAKVFRILTLLDNGVTIWVKP